MTKTNEAVKKIEDLERVARDARPTELPYVISPCDDVEFLCGALRAMAEVLRKTDRAFTPAKDGKEAIEIYEAQKAAVLEFRDGPYAELLELKVEPASREKGKPNESSN